MDKFKRLLTKDIGMRPLLYVLVIFLWMLCLLVWLYSDSEVWEGLFVEACSVIVSVFMIDSLISADRKSKLKKANEINTKSVDFTLTWSISRISTAVGLKTTIEDITDEISLKEFKVRVSALKLSEEMRKYLEGFRLVDKKLLKKLDTLEKLLEGNRKSISDAVKKMYPTPNPSIIDLVDKKHVTGIAYLRSRYEVVKGMVIEIPKKYNNPSPEDKKIRDEGFQAIWNLIMNKDSEDSLGSIESALFGILDDYIFIKMQSDKGRLHFDI